MSTKNTLPTLIILFLLTGLSIFILNRQQPAAEQNSNESAEKKEWELNMLRDPATGKIPEGIRSREMFFYNALPKNNYKRGADWRLRGPWNVGGRTRSMGIDVRNEKHMIAGSVSGGLWQTTDGGGSWQKVSAPNMHPGIVSIAQDTRDGFRDTWYAMSGEIIGTSASETGAFYYGDGAFKSVDNGNTWQPLASTAIGNLSSFTTNYQGGWRIAVSPLNGDIYLALYSSILRSTDGGVSFLPVLASSNSSPSYYSDIAISQTGIIYACLSFDGNKRGFYRSIDGTNFTSITPNYLQGYDRTVIEIDPNDENTVYFLSKLSCDSCGGVATSNYQGTKEFVSFQRYTYKQGNGEWANLSANLPIYSSAPFDNFNCQGGYDLMVRVQPGNPNNIVIGGTNLYRSTDGFNSPNYSKQIGGYGIGTTIPFFEVYPNHHPDLHDVYFSKNNAQIMYSVSDGGVHRTDNFLASNVAWQNLSGGYVTTQCYTVNIDEKNAGDKRMMIGLQDNGNYVSLSDHQQQEWRLPVNGDGSFGYISPNNDFYVTSIQLGRIVKIKVDERGNIVRRRRIDPAGKTKDDYLFIHPFAVDPNNENFTYLPIGKRLYRLDNLSEIAINNNYDQLTDAWIDMKDSITTPNVGTNAAFINCIAVSQKPANIVYIGTNNQEIWRIDNANSANPIWSKTSTAFLPGGANVNYIAIDPDDANKVLVGYSNYNVHSLCYTTSGGQQWYRVGGTLESSNNIGDAAPSIRSVGILKMNDGSRKYFAGTSVGLYSTSVLDTQFVAGTTWEQESPNLIAANIVTDIKIRQSDGYVAIGTHGNGVFESYYNSPQNPATSPLQVVANNIFPNPANNVINFGFATGDDADIQVYFYNISGQQIRNFPLGLHTKGTFQYSVDVSSLPSGFYFMTVQSGQEYRDNLQKIVIQH